jgi:phosphatidylglycerophosphate synthase
MTASASLQEILDKRKKPENIWFRIFYFFSSFVVWISVRLHVTPNQLTTTALVLNCSGLVFFLTSKSGSTQVFVAAAVFAIAHLLDCADGHLAFVSNQRSECGYWLDSTFDIFKIAIITTCFTKMILAPALPFSESFGILRTIALAAAPGLLVDYAVSLHAMKYMHLGDPYVATQISSIGAARSTFVRFFLSLIREYGNLLLIFVLFGVNQNVALVLFAVFGLCHFLLALARVVRIARVI